MGGAGCQYGVEYHVLYAYGADTIQTCVCGGSHKEYTVEKSKIEKAAIVGLILLNIGLGVASQPVIKAIEAGLAMFG
ncbi:MAG: hypothetical protein ACLR1V_05165 [Coprococcus sp.]